jgi:uncharacterized membrane protein (DUF106 family)
MLDFWNDLSLAIFDGLFGWLLILPRTFVLIVVALVTATLITVVRKWTTNQDRLCRAAADSRRLNELIREAKRHKDREALARYRATKAQIGMLKFKAEGLPLVTYLLPLALLATWAFYRLEFYPPRAEEEIQVTAYLPASARGDVVHLVPQPGLRAVNGWVQSVRQVSAGPTAWDRFWARVTFHEVREPEADDVAIWRLQGNASSEPYPLVLRWRDRTYERELRIGQNLYSPAMETWDDGKVALAVAQKEVRLFGIPGLGSWLPGWIVGYFLLTIPLFFLLKRVLRIY